MPYVPLPMLGNASVPAYGSANGLGFQKLEKFCTSHQKWKEERYGDWKSIQRVDARAKVTGQAKYTQDLMTQPMMVAKVVHSTIANGVVTGFDLDEALKVPGVIKIVTCLMCRRLILYAGASVVCGGGASGCSGQASFESAGPLLWR